ncbi:MAG: type-4 uracil-DNA glycosylase [Candidatus Aenigmatarchaeota archaeon]
MNTRNEKIEQLEKIAEEIRNCKKCDLFKYRKNTVPGEGNIEKRIVLIGEAPGYNEDIQGRPFVGKAGKLLEELIKIAGLKREDIFITNVVKCRPPNNRQPEKSEIESCFSYLERQLEIINPRIIICVGNVAASSVFPKFGLEFLSMNKQHGKIYSISNLRFHLKIVATYHPAAILRNPNLLQSSKEDWEKIKEVVEWEY